MSYREQMHGLALAVGELLRDGAGVPDEHLDLALTAHTAVVQALNRIHRGVTRVGPNHAATVAGLERDPVGVLGRILHEHPQESPIALSEVMAADPQHPVARRWRHAARHATLAAHEWENAELPSLPTGEAAWAELADVATLAEAVTLLDRDLATALEAAGRTELARRFNDAATSGLATAALATRTLALSGPIDPHPLLGAHPDLVPRPGRKVVPVRTAANLPAALDRLGHLLERAADISPAHVQLIARALATASHNALATLERLEPDGAPVVAALKDQIAALVAVNGAPRRAASLAPSDPTPLAQAREIYEYLSAAGRRAEPLTEHVARRVAHSAGQATSALGDTVDRQVFQDRWLAPTAGSSRTLNWERLLRTEELPQLVERARRAAELAGRVVAAEPSASRRLPWVPPRTALAEAVSRATGTAVRPEVPRSRGRSAAR